MAKICPVDGEKVIYLYCQECDDKKCLFPAPSEEELEEELESE